MAVLTEERGAIGQDVAGSDPTAETIRTRVLSGLDDAYRLAFRILRDPHAAQDAVQIAALRAWEHRDSMRDPTSATAWFRRIVVNVCRDELRQRSRRPNVMPLDLAAGQLAGSLADRPDLTGLIAGLSADDQVLLALRFGRDLTVGQIAETLGVPEGTVKSRLHAAIARLRAAAEADLRATEAAR